MSYLNRPLSWEDPPDDPPTCDECGDDLEQEVDGDMDEDGKIYPVAYSWCPNEKCPESPNYEEG